MVDCVSLPNAAELVEYLRSDAKELSYMVNGKVECNVLWKAADAIETLLAENEKLKEKCDKCGESAHSVIKELIEQNAKLKAEMDAAVADLTNSSECWTCGKNGKTCGKLSPQNPPSIRCGGYEWRGLQKEEEDG